MDSHFRKTKVAVVGYEKLRCGMKTGMLSAVSSGLEKMGLEICYIGIVEILKNKHVEDAVKDILSSGPDVLLYTNYRDGSLGRFDEAFITAVKKTTSLSILLTSSSPEAKIFAERLGIELLPKPWTFNVLAGKILWMKPEGK